MTFGIDTVVNEWHTFACARGRGKTGVTADRDKIEFRLFNSSSIFNITLREELFSLPKKKTKHVVLSWFHGASHLSQVPWREVEGHYSPFFLFNLTFFPSGKANQKKRTWYWKLEINRICADRPSIKVTQLTELLFEVIKAIFIIEVIKAIFIIALLISMFGAELYTNWLPPINRLRDFFLWHHAILQIAEFVVTLNTFPDFEIVFASCIEFKKRGVLEKINLFRVCKLKYQNPLWSLWILCCKDHLRYTCDACWFLKGSWLFSSCLP